MVDELVLGRRTTRGSIAMMPWCIGLVVGVSSGSGPGLLYIGGKRRNASSHACENACELAA